MEVSGVWAQKKINGGHMNTNTNSNTNSNTNAPFSKGCCGGVLRDLVHAVNFPAASHGTLFWSTAPFPPSL